LGLLVEGLGGEWMVCGSSDAMMSAIVFSIARVCESMRCWFGVAKAWCLSSAEVLVAVGDKGASELTHMQTQMS